MIIYRKKSSLSKISFDFFATKNRPLLILAIILSFLCFFLVGMVFVFGRTKFSLFYNEQKTKIREITNSSYFRFKNPQPEHIDLDISFENWQKIIAKREEALEAGILLTNDNDFVPATLRFENKKIPIKLRLKGDWTDHLEGKRWSFRVQIKGNNAFKGMRYFSLQDPKTRFFANEWVFYQVLKQEGLIALRYDFIDVSVNGEHKGTYAIEEHFSKELIENNQRREGPILKFSEDRVWSNNLLYELLENTEKGQAYRSEIQAFKINKTLADPKLTQEFVEAQRILDLYRQKSIEAEQVFNLDQWARLYALSDVFNVEHGLTTHNLRYYYNPITGLIEPIAFDQMIEKRIAQLRIETDTVFSDFPGIFENKKFVALYIKYLDQYSQPEFLNRFLIAQKDELKKVEAMINRDQYYRFSPNFFYINQNFIRKKITDVPAIRSFITSDQQLSVNALTELPVEVISLNDSENNKIIDFSQNPLFVPGAKKTSVPKKILVPLKQALDFSQLENYSVSYRFLGLTTEYKAPLTRWVIDNQNKRYQSQTSAPYFAHYELNSQTYYVRAGNWKLENDWVISSEKKLVIEPGTSLDLQNSSAIISHGPVLFSGSPEQKIKIYSSDKTGQGILVLDAKGESQISYAEFDSLSNIQTASNNITGAVTFYKSPVKIDHVIFTNNSSEDMLNIVDTSFAISDSSFVNSFADGLDVDFGTGTIANTTFNHLTNDAIDVSGSSVEIDRVVINSSQDKGVSVGEKSRVEIKNCEVNDSNLAFASKDNSELTVRLCKVNNSKIAYAIYQKKPEFGPARMVVWNTILSNVSRENLIEKNSVLSLNGNDYVDDQKNVYQQLLQNYSSNDSN